MYGGDEILALLYINPKKAKDPFPLLTERLEKINKEVNEKMKEYLAKKDIKYDNSLTLGVKYRIISLDEELKYEGIEGLRRFFVL